MRNDADDQSRGTLESTSLDQWSFPPAGLWTCFYPSATKRSAMRWLREPPRQHESGCVSFDVRATSCSACSSRRRPCLIVREHSASNNEQMGDELKADVALLPDEISELTLSLERDARYVVMPTSTDSVILLHIARQPASLAPREDVRISCANEIVVTFHAATRRDREEVIQLMTICLTRDDRPVVFEPL